MADTLTDTLTGTYRTWLAWSRTDTQEVGSVNNAKNDYSIYSIADGSGAGQADLVFADQRTIQANTIESFDLLNLSQQALGVSVPFVFRQLRMVRLVNESTATGARLLVGVDPGRPTSVYAASIGPASEWSAINHQDSWLVTAANSVVRICNPTASPITYSLYLIGTSTAAA